MQDVPTVFDTQLHQRKLHAGGSSANGNSDTSPPGSMVRPMLSTLLPRSSGMMSHSCLA